MPVSLRLLDATAVGAQTLRLVTALVCSVSVTTAVAGPMAYRAIEYRVHESAMDEPVGAAPERGVLDHAATAPGAALLRPTAAPLVAQAAISVTSSTSADTTSQPSTTVEVTLAPAAVAPASPAASDIPPQIYISVPETPAEQTPAMTTVAAPTPPPAVVTVPVATPTTADALAEFNPRPSCDDKAQELNVGNRLDCPSTTSAR